MLFWTRLVLEHDGNIKTGFPISGGQFTEGDPALVDVNDDGLLEIFATYNGLHAFDHNGNELWFHPYDGPIFQSYYRPKEISIADLNNDGLPEIVVTCYLGGAVFVFDSNGNVLPGWPYLIPPIQSGWGPPPIMMSASIGDIDSDGLKEICFGTVQDEIYCLKPDGSICSGFPVAATSTSGYNHKFVLADIAGNNNLEVLIPDHQNQSFTVVDFQGNIIHSMPLSAWELSVGDPNDDGVLDVGFYAWGQYHMLELDTFTELPNFPSDFAGTAYHGMALSRCNFADINGDEQQELVCGSGCCGFVPDGTMFAMDLDGNMVDGFPMGPYYHSYLGLTFPVISDLDGDGDLEICKGSYNGESVVPRETEVYCWDIDHPYNLDNIDWAMDGFDYRHTGRWRKLYHIDKISSTLTVEGCAASPCIFTPNGSLREVTVTATRQADGSHPSGQDVRFSRTLGCGEYEGPVVDNGDGTYTRMLRSPASPCFTDIHAWVNEFKLDQGVQISFASCAIDLGDVNLNGSISALDAAFILHSVVGLMSLDEWQTCRADVNENGQVTSLDAAYTLMCVVGNCASLPTLNFGVSCFNHGNCF